MRACKRFGKGALFIAFGVGLLLACWFPPNWVLGILAVIIVVLGITSCQRHC